MHHSVSDPTKWLELVLDWRGGAVGCQSLWARYCLVQYVDENVLIGNHTEHVPYTCGTVSGRPSHRRDLGACMTRRISLSPLFYTKLLGADLWEFPSPMQNADTDHQGMQTWYWPLLEASIGILSLHQVTVHRSFVPFHVFSSSFIVHKNLNPIDNTTTV